MKKKWMPSDFAFAGLLLAAGIFLLWKCRFGFGSGDEAFYLTVPYRLYQGDALLVEEWHVSQMAGVLLLPSLAVYLDIFKSTEGILLAFRYLYTVVTVLFACFYYCRLRKLNGMAAAVAALSFCVFAPYAIMELSYNSMGIIALLTACVILATMERRQRLQTGIAGAFFAASVLCCPYLAVLYPLYGLLILASACWRRACGEQREPSFLLTARAWGSLTVGIGVVAAAFLVFVLSRATVTKVLEALPNVLGDPSHPVPSVREKLSSYRWKMMHSNNRANDAAIGIGALGLILCHDRKRRVHKGIYLIAACLLSGSYLYPFVTAKTYTNINFIMLPINILGLFSAVVSEDVRAKRLFYAGWLPGMAYTLCIHMSSDQELYAISLSATVATVFSIIMAGMAAKEALAGEKKGIGRLAAFCVVALLAVQLGAQVLFRYTSVFWDGKQGELDLSRTVQSENTQNIKRR